LKFFHEFGGSAARGRERRSSSWQGLSDQRECKVLI
jgi:hypothetical protein